jgi:excisionase family DNA binding protein
METLLAGFKPQGKPLERLAYSIHEAAEMLGVHHFSVLWLVQQKRLRVCREFPGHPLIPRSELLRLLNSNEGD